MPDERTIETDVPARLDRLPWSGWHGKIILALGTSWLLDGLQVTLAGSRAGILKDKMDWASPILKSPLAPPPTLQEPCSVPSSSAI